MADTRAQKGLVLAGLGAGALGISVFLPWYQLSVTDSGVAAAQQGVDQAFQQLNAPGLQGLAGQLKNSFSGLSGHTFGSVNAHQSLKVISVILLIFAGLALVAALLRLADSWSSVTAGQLAVLGVVAAGFVVYRIADPPQSYDGYLSLSVSWGAWLALVSCVTIIAGAFWASSRRLESWLGIDETAAWP